MEENNHRGGYRLGSGRKGQWKSGTTKAVKLPEALIPRLLELAKILDEGGEVIEVARFTPSAPPPPDRLSWNVYRRIEQYDQWKGGKYWGDWELSKACQSEAKADGWIAQYEQWNRESNARTDGALIQEQYEKRLERISPAIVPHPRPDDAVLGGQ